MPPYLKAKISEGARYGTFDDVEGTFRISRSKAYALIRDGLITARKLGSHTLVDLHSVDAYLASLPDAKLAPSKSPNRRAQA